MHESYPDIRDRIEEDPTWYDSNGTPRYGEFSPERCPNMYTRTVFLLRIACQHCGREFDVEMHERVFESIEHPQELHYGDPPAHGCTGDSMNCEDLEVLEVWRANPIEGCWHRHPELEGEIT